MHQPVTLRAIDGNEIAGVLGYLRKGIKAKTAIFAHGWKANKDHKLIYKIAQRLEENAWTTLRFNFRSTGKNLEPYLEDLSSAMQFCQTCPEVNQGKVLLIGHSLGGISALHFSVNNPDLRAVISIGAPFRLRFDEDSVQKITLPTLIIHSDHDERVPFSEGKKLFQLIGGDTVIEKKFITFQGGDHSLLDAEMNNKAADLVLEWLRSLQI